MGGGTESWHSLHSSQGLSVSEAIQTLRERGVVTGQTTLELELLLSDLNDNYRLFGLWEAMLHQVRGGGAPHLASLPAHHVHRAADLPARPWHSESAGGEVL